MLSEIEMATSSYAAILPKLLVTIPYIGEVSITKYLVATAIFLVLSLAFKLLQMVIIVRLKAISTRTTTDIDDMLLDAVGSVKAWVYTLIALYVALQTLTLPELFEKILTAIFLFAVVWQTIKIIATIIDFSARKLLEKDKDGDGQIDPAAATTSHMISLIAQIVLWSLGALFVLSNLGVEVTSLLAGLGIGGIAIAFALQGILSDLFASFSLYFDKPFRIGDFIVIGTDSGTVEKIGIKSTRIRTLQGEELVVSNAELTTARVQNFKKMQKRRIATQFGVTYETAHEAIKDIPTIVQRIFEDDERADLDRVHFMSFGDSALIFELVYFVQSSDYKVFMDVQQDFNFKLMERFAEVGINFAYPTQTIYTKTIV